MDQWVDRGVEPPPSNYPTLADRGRERDRGDEDDDDDDDDGDRKRRDRDHRHSIRHGTHNAATLVSLQEASEFFPAIPGVSFPTVMNQYELLDFGRRFGKTGGILKVQPPELGPSYRMFVPAPDKDGHDIAGIQPMQIRVPLDTTMGWNLRAPGHRAPDLCGLTGSFIPFARTKAERLAVGDPRLSLEERFKDHDGFVNAVRAAARQLIRERFLLQVDADGFIAAAEAGDILR
jgi:hypothetical protein